MSKNQLAIPDRISGWIVDRFNYVKYRTASKAPPYIARELANNYGIDWNWISDYNEEELQQLAIKVSWVYSNIDRIAKEVSDARIEVYQRGSNQRDIDHEFETLMEYPNEFFGRMALLQYTVWALELSEDGAYWYLAPDSNGKIREIWPIQMNKLTPVKHPTKFISHYEYHTNNSEKPLVIPSQYICRFFFPDPFDMWKSMSPLYAAKMAIDIYYGISKSQRSLFTEGGGIPLSVVTLDPNINNADFATVRQQIKEDWEQQKRIAIARAGTIDIKTVGISNKELEAIESQSANRDEIDSVFMGIPWRTGHFLGGEGIREANRQVRERVIHPLHTLISTQIQIQIIERYYAKDLIVKFEDVRQFDRALAVQEHSVNWRAKTFDEARFDLGLPPYQNKDMPDLGNMPIHLAINPAFVSNKYGLNPVRDPQKKPDGVGNLPDSMSPEALTNLTASGNQELDATIRSIDITQAVNEGIKEELKRYKKVILRSFRRDNSVDRQFETDIIPYDIMSTIKDELNSISSEDEIVSLFNRFIETHDQ